METERAIKLLDTKLQDPFRILAAKKLQQISNAGNHGGRNQRRLLYILKSINNKLATGKAMIARADKGRTTIVMYTNEYTSKVQSFLRENNFHTLQKDPTKKYHRTLQSILQQSNLVIDKRKIKFLMQKYPRNLWYLARYSSTAMTKTVAAIRVWKCQ